MQKSSTRYLVLDAGGVLLTEPVPELLAEMARRGDRDQLEINRFFAEEMYRPLWSGSLPKIDFWLRLIDFSGCLGTPAEWEKFFLDRLLPQPAMAMLNDWRPRVDGILVLSNHLLEWLFPLLSSALEKGLVDSLLVSSETGHVKPQKEAFLDVFAVPGVRREAGLLFVDDRSANVAAAEDVGLDGIVADAAGLWTARVDDWVRAEKPVR